MNVDKKKQIEILNKLSEYDSAPVNTSSIKSALSAYEYPNNKIASLTEDGFLIRLKKGVFAVSPDITGAVPNKYVISNNLYGPSYISFQSALYYYGLIPEAVFSTTAVTFKRSKTYSTPFGTFKYYHVPGAYYSIGFTVVSEEGASYSIALKEKALCDLVVLNRGQKLQTKRALLTFLEENMRIDMEGLSDFSMDIIDACIDIGIKKNEIRLLREIINDYK